MQRRSVVNGGRDARALGQIFAQLVTLRDRDGELVIHGARIVARKAKAEVELLAIRVRELRPLPIGLIEMEKQGAEGRGLQIVETGIEAERRAHVRCIGPSVKAQGTQLPGESTVAGHDCPAVADATEIFVG